MKDLMTGANDQGKFPAGEDNVSFTLFPDDNRVCDKPEGGQDICRNVRSPCT